MIKFNADEVVLLSKLINNRVANRQGYIRGNEESIAFHEYVASKNRDYSCQEIIDRKNGMNKRAALEISGLNAVLIKLQHEIRENLINYIIYCDFKFYTGDTFKDLENKTLEELEAIVKGI